ncbi:LysE family translocator [Govanella unica]|uniref:LysE family translocator n=1 Tax=Govanella unica TaxID=2975056 RepID=A0A9X3Z8J8_9PROT|nr:LysE family translocator [Govania unica]MDA5195063.1 LysE family translocator [Govania unica]
MDLLSLGGFATTVFVAALVPGPGIAAVVSRVLGRGTDGAAAFLLGMMLGDVAWVTMTVMGLAVIAQSFHELFLAIKYAGAAYLLYLAVRMWNAPPMTEVIEGDRRPEHPLRLLLTGFALNISNPKVMIFYMALLPAFFDLQRLSLTGYFEIIGVVFAMLALVLGGYVLLANRARRFMQNPRAQRIVSRSSGGVMAGAAIAIAVG